MSHMAAGITGMWLATGSATAEEIILKMFYRCVWVMGKNTRNLDRGSKQVFGHMQENKSNFQGD